MLLTAYDVIHWLLQYHWDTRKITPSGNWFFFQLYVSSPYFTEASESFGEIVFNKIEEHLLEGINWKREWYSQVNWQEMENFDCATEGLVGIGYNELCYSSGNVLLL